jgi:hypothetical protein
MRITTKFVSQFLELKYVNNIFLKHFSFQIIIEKLNSFLILTNGSAQWKTPAHCQFRPQQPAREEELARLGLRPTDAGLEKQRGRERGVATTSGVHDVAAARWSLVANGHPSHERAKRSAHEVHEEMANTGPRCKGSEGDGGGARAQRPDHGGACGKSSTEPYRRRARHTVARSEERRRWRSVECKKSGGGGSPASERGGGDSVKEW